MSSIKLIIFDLDGVLIDSRDMHFISLNLALHELDTSDKYVISMEEHLAKYDGYPTSYKLQLLTREKSLDVKMHQRIWQRKQELTQQVILEHYKQDERICYIMRELKHKGYTLYCASNSIWATVKNALLRKGFMEFIDYFISNEEIKNPKPSPEIYFKCFERHNITPREVLICEDSPIGRRAAVASGANLCPIENINDLTLDKITMYIDKYQYEMKCTNTTCTNESLINIVIPCAGIGSRFVSAGYSFPKLLIDVNGKPMIQVVVENINIRGRFIFIIQKSHCEKYNLNYLLNAISPGCIIIEIDEVTEGSACSVLLAKKYIDNDYPLIIANSDQFLEWDARHFLYTCMSKSIDGCISTFKNSHPKFSFVSVNAEGYVTRVAEKKVISDNATTGIYYWSKGNNYVKYAEQMISKNIRINGEFYTCPVYNEAIEDGKKIKITEARTFWCLGTPEDLQHYLYNHIS